MRIEDLDDIHLKDFLLSDLQGKFLSKKIEEKKIIELIENKNWKKLSILLKSIYGEKISNCQSLKEIVKQKFMHHFNPQITKKFSENAEVLLSAFPKKSYLMFKMNNKCYCFFAQSKTKKTFVEPFKSGKTKFYDLYVVQIDSEKNTAYFNCTKKQYKTFEKYATSKVDITDAAKAKDFTNFALPIDFIEMMRQRGCYVTNFKFKSQDIRLQFKDNNSIGINPNIFIDVMVILRDKKSLLNIQRIDFILEKNDIEFSIKQHVNSNKTSFTLDFPSGTSESDIKKIKKLMNSIGMDCGIPLVLPKDYLVDKLLSTNSQYRKKYTKPLEEEYPLIWKSLFDKEILRKNKKYYVDIDKEKISKLVLKNLKECKGMISSNMGDYKLRVTKVNKSGHEIIFDYELLNESPSIPSSKEKGKIPLYTRPSSIEKFHSTMLERHNLGELLLSEKKDLLDYLLKEILYHEKYLRPTFLWKQFRESLNFLKRYVKSPKKIHDENDFKKIGNLVELHSGVLLKQLVGNYYSKEGNVVPDNIFKINSRTFLVDCKMQQKLNRDEIRKQKEYLEKYKEQNSNCVSVILYSRNLMSSLKTDSRRGVFLQDNCLAMSLDFIYSLAQIYYEKFDFIENLDEKRRFQNIVWRSLNHGMNKKHQVEKNEDKLLLELKKEFSKMEIK